MTDKAVNLDTPEAIREAIAVLAAELVSLKEMQVATTKLVQAMDTRIRALTSLIDYHHTVLTKIAGLPPRPKGDASVN
jgi:hypothetical protein